MTTIPNHGSSLKLAILRKAKWKYLSASILVSLMIFFNISTAKAGLPIEVAEGYELELVATGVVPTPSSMAFDLDGNTFYVSSAFTGQISAVDTLTGNVSVLTPPVFLGGLDGTMGLAVHPTTGMLYVSNKYLADPAGDPCDPANVKSRISIVDPDTGSTTTFVDGIPGMIFGELPCAITGSQGIDFDKAGNLYIAQGINDVSREDGDPNQSAILKIDKDGNVSVFASGLRAPYDVRVAKENKRGNATILYAGDNGEGAMCDGCLEEGRTSRQYYDELNRVLEGKHYGWPGGSYVGEGEEATLYPGESHIGPLWNFEAVPPNDFWPAFTWVVPTGIDILKGKWNKGVKDPLFLAFFNCPSMFAPDLGTIEMFTGRDYSNRITLAKYIDGPIDVRIDNSVDKTKDRKLYFAEFATGDIYSIAPAK